MPQSLYVIILGFVILCLLVAAPVSAIKVSGLKYMGTISPGDTIVHSMTVGSSLDDRPMDMQVDVLGFWQSVQQNYNSILPTDDVSPYSARSMITLSTPTFHLITAKQKL